MNGLVHSLRTRLGGDTLLGKGGAMTLTRAVTIVSGLGLSVVLARSLGADGYGQYLFALALAQMLAMPALMGLPTLLIRQIAIYRSKAETARIIGIVRWALALVFGAALLIAVGMGLYVSAQAISGRLGDMNWLYLWTIPFMLGTGLMALSGAILHGFQRPVWGSLPDGFIRPLALFGFVLAVALLGGLTPMSAMGLHIAAILLAFAWAAVMVRRQCDLGFAEPLRAPAVYEIRAWFSSLWPISLTVAASTINSRLDVVMLGALKTSSDVAVYGLAVLIAALVLVPQTIFNTIIAPRIAAAGAAGDHQTLQASISTVCTLSFAGALCSVILLWLVGRPMIALFFGGEFETVYGVLLLLSLGHVCVSSMAGAMIALNMLQQERRVAAIVVISAVANIAFNALLIPPLGVLGAAIATIITNVALQLACAVMLYRSHRIVCWIAWPKAVSSRGAMKSRT